MFCSWWERTSTVPVKVPPSLRHYLRNEIYNWTLSFSLPLPKAVLKLLLYCLSSFCNQQWQWNLCLDDWGHCMFCLQAKYNTGKESWVTENHCLKKKLISTLIISHKHLWSCSVNIAWIEAKRPVTKYYSARFLMKRTDIFLLDQKFGWKCKQENCKRDAKMLHLFTVFPYHLQEE